MLLPKRTDWDGEVRQNAAHPSLANPRICGPIVTPAKAGVHVDSGFRRNDGLPWFPYPLYEILHTLLPPSSETSKEPSGI